MSVSLKTSFPMGTRGAGGIAGLGRDHPSSGELGRQEPLCCALPNSAAVSRCCCLAKAVANNRAFTWKGRGVKLSSPSAARVPSPPLSCRRVLWTSSQLAASSTTWCREGSTPSGTACGARPTSWRALTSCPACRRRLTVRLPGGRCLQQAPRARLCGVPRPPCSLA